MIDIPIYIISFNRLSCLLQLLDVLGDRRITIIDNASTYPPLLDFLDRTEHKVMRLAENLGHEAPWYLGLTNRETEFAITDPDVLPSENCPSDTLEFCLDVLHAHSDYIKAGPALSLDIPDTYAFANTVISWESKYYCRRLDDFEGVPIYPAPLDTTFAVYRPHVSYSIAPALRIGKPYEWRHLPWYSDSKNLTEEEIFYSARANRNSATWLPNEIGDPQVR